jgi:enolase-phosphatase E1
MTQAILTDIEGTTSSISFVKDVLFPYARQHLADFIKNNREMPEVKHWLEETRKEVQQPDLDEQGVIDVLINWIDQDKKITPLKALQGLIWEAGYKNKDYQGHIYPDAVEHLKQWKDKGLNLFIFSSGSIKAQQLLFAHTAFGDLTPLFSGYFDTTIGAKQQVGSYQVIAQQMGTLPEQILFLSDIIGELDAAKAAGMQTTCLMREGNLHSNCEHPQVKNFNELMIS